MRKNWKFTAIGLFLAAGTAQAQVWNETANGGGDAGEFPGTAQTVIGSGTLSQITGNLNASDTDMYLIQICDAPNFIADVQGTWDSQLWLFRPDGTGVLFVDDRAANLAAYMDNASGAIAANGEYLLTITRFARRAYDGSNQLMWNATPYFPARQPDGPGAAGALASWVGTTTALTGYQINLTGACYIAPVVPVPPAIGATVAGLLEPTRQVTFTATVSPGFNPASTSYTVTADLSTFGGSSSVAMFDNGTNGDPVANDLQYTLVYTIPGTTTPGAYAPQFNVTDQVPRSNSSVLNLTVTAKSWNELVDGGGDAGELPGTAQTPAGSGTLARISGAFDVGPDADMYRVEICDFANFSATTAGNSTVDTQLFLFRDTGTGVMHNDDNGTPQSTIDNSGGLLTGNGNFYLAVTAYNRDPVDSSNALLWANTPFTGIRAPDGPAASNAVAAWTGTGGTGAYAIDLTGVCHYNPATPTPPSIVGNITGLIAGNIEAGRTILLTGTVTAGTNPASTSYTVTVDLNQLGGSGTQAMYDDGTNGDLVLGDGVYSYAYSVPGSTSPGPVTIGFSVTDQLARSGAASLNRTVAARSWNETADGSGDAGDLPGTAQTVTGTGTIDAITGDMAASDTDMYAINICDTGTFVADVQGTWDSQLWLFRTNGSGVLFVDDRATSLAALMDNASGAVSAPGNYLLAITRYNRRAVDASNQDMWLGGAPYYPARQPDGPGAAGIVSAWNNVLAPAAFGDYRINLTGVCAFVPGQSTPPGLGASIVGAIQPTRTILLTAAVSPGENPASTSYTVTVDLNQLGGSGTQAMYDDGTNGDLVLGDGVYSYAYTIPGSQPLGPVAIQFSVTDQVPRTTTVTLNRTVAPKSWDELVDGGSDAGDLPASAQVPVGSGSFELITGALTTGDTDMFKIAVCDTASFSASTVGGATFDTMLWLFDTNGLGVIANDDAGGLQSTLTNPSLVTVAGDYYLAITGFYREPVGTGPTDYIWDSYTNVSPDGVGAANPVGAWVGTGTTGSYTITLLGACYPGGGSAGCNPADVATEGSAQPFIDGPDGFITGTDFDVFVQAFFQEIRRPEPTGPYIADLTNGDGTGGPDGFITGSDFDFFIIKFFAGCP